MTPASQPTYLAYLSYILITDARAVVRPGCRSEATTRPTSPRPRRSPAPQASSPRRCTATSARSQSPTRGGADPWTSSPARRRRSPGGGDGSYGDGNNDDDDDDEGNDDEENTRYTPTGVGLERRRGTTSVCPCWYRYQTRRWVRQSSSGREKITWKVLLAGSHGGGGTGTTNIVDSYYLRVVEAKLYRDSDLIVDRRADPLDGCNAPREEERRGGGTGMTNIVDSYCLRVVEAKLYRDPDLIVPR
jgi:hypothetical protein